MVNSPGVSPGRLWAWAALAFGLCMYVTEVTSQGTGVVTDSTYLRQCCSAKLMSSLGNVMIETEVPLPEKKFCAIILRFCTTDPVQIQIWTKTGDNTYVFKWAQEFTPTQQQTKSPFDHTFLLSNAVEIGPDDRLGIYAPPKSTHPIPFESNGSDDQYSFFLSEEKYTTGDFTTSTTIVVDTVRWPRSFRPYLAFCECSDDNEICNKDSVYPFDASRDLILVVGPPGAQGPAGPPGPAGTPGWAPDFVGGDTTISCDVPDVTTAVIKASERIQTLEGIINTMQQTIDNIYNSNSVTGLCPSGMVAGSYGVGSCYAFRKELASMAVAELLCKYDFDAHLVSIETDVEERFLKTQILSLAASEVLQGTDEEVTERYWTSGMYSPEDNAGWVWYNEYRLRQPIHQYRNWKTPIGGVPGTAPVPESHLDICSTFNVNLRSTTADWTKEICYRYRYYICELPKRCL